MRTLADVLRMGVSWGAIWLALGIVLIAIIGVFDPDSIDPGEGPLEVGGIIGGVGLLSGAIFAVLLAVFERGRRIAEVPRVRVLVWGVAASLVFPVLTKIDRASLTCVLGAIAALAVAMWARRSQRRGAPGPVRVTGVPGDT